MIIIPNFKDLTGHRFGKWTVLNRAENKISKTGNTFVVWNCVCDCGCQKNVYASSLQSGRSKSCGCEQRSMSRENAKLLFTTHGETKTRLYQIWAGVKKRCCNPQAYNYKDYGGRGITMCKEWLNDYLVFKQWAIDNGYAENLSIDRIDVNGNYEPSNCRWADRQMQCNNKRNSRKFEIDGVKKTLAEWAREYNVPYKRVHKRIQKGISIKDALY